MTTRAQAIAAAERAAEAALEEWLAEGHTGLDYGPREMVRFIARRAINAAIPVPPPPAPTVDVALDVVYRYIVRNIDASADLIIDAARERVFAGQYEEERFMSCLVVSILPSPTPPEGLRPIGTLEELFEAGE